ncbi:hypothetical protein CEXT_435781 [Caerostris extrusa]|uniref:Uncharacterized protein n=1 Tax=Caerostris extrusa TaxID=172846 RepID=A0AAV4Q8T1_CAEEX|nr:hypothetical protein CEXT_435781 [Caerostris extrusa]
MGATVNLKNSRLKPPVNQKARVVLTTFPSGHGVLDSDSIHSLPLRSAQCRDGRTRNSRRRWTAAHPLDGSRLRI